MLQPTIYIGIGGFGLRAISQTKKLFEDEYGVGNIPGRVAFIGIDFDSLEINNSQFPTDISDDCIVLDSATIRSSRDYYARLKHANVLNWMFEMNESLLTDSNHGARQARTTGRLLAELFLQRIESRVVHCFNKVLNASYGPRGVVDVQILTSLAGGTGAGSFLTVAALLKRKFQNNVNIVGYGLLHGVYREMDRGPGTMRVASNAYASILELDFFQSARFSNPVRLNLAGIELSFNEPLFDDFFVIDNLAYCNGALSKFDLPTLCERLGHNLYMNARTGFHSFAVAALWRDGRFDVQNKIGWVSSFGACSIVYDGEKLAKAYSYKAAIAICEQLLCRCASADSEECLLWMREVGLVDSSEDLSPLLDSFMPASEIATLKLPMLDAAVSDSENIKTLSEYLSAVNDLLGTDDIVSVRVVLLVELLKRTVNDWVIHDYGLEGAKHMLLILKSIMEHKIIDVNSESKLLTAEVEEKRSMIDVGWSEYDRFKRSILPRSLLRKQEMLEDCVSGPARQVLCLNYELWRRLIACRMLDSLISRIDSFVSRIDMLRCSLDKNRYRYMSDLSRLYGFDSQFSEIDLAHEEFMNMKVDPDGLFVSDFFNAEKFDVSDIAGDDFYEKLLAFTYSLPKAEAYKNTTVLDVIDALPQDQYDRLKHEVYINSASIIRLNGRGLITRTNMPVEESLCKEVRVLLFDKPGEPSRLEQDKFFFNNMNGILSIEKTPAGSAKKRVFINVIERGFIPYCIESLNTSVEREYSSCICDSAHPYNPHIGEDVYGQIQNSNFSLRPDFD